MTTTAVLEESPSIKRSRVVPPPPGIYPGVPFAVYAIWAALNQSALKHADRSLAHVAHALTVVDDEPGEAMVLGQATHTLALEGAAAFDERFFVMPKVNRSTNVGKAAHAAALVQAAKDALSVHDVYSTPETPRLLPDVAEKLRAALSQEGA
jgi:hypothetical protein